MFEPSRGNTTTLLTKDQKQQETQPRVLDILRQPLRDALPLYRLRVERHVTERTNEQRKKCKN